MAPPRKHVAATDDGGWSYAALEGRRIGARGQTPEAFGLATGIAQAISTFAAERREW